jgi:hypothetical protein
MTLETFEKASRLKAQIDSLNKFIRACKRNRNIRFYKKRGLTVTVSDYLQSIELYECTPSMRDKFIVVLEQELAELESEFKKLGGVN